MHCTPHVRSKMAHFQAFGLCSSLPAPPTPCTPPTSLPPQRPTRSLRCCPLCLPSYPLPRALCLSRSPSRLSLRRYQKGRPRQLLFLSWLPLRPCTPRSYTTQRRCATPYRASSASRSPRHRTRPHGTALARDSSTPFSATTSRPARSLRVPHTAPAIQMSRTHVSSS